MTTTSVLSVFVFLDEKKKQREGWKEGVFFLGNVGKECKGLGRISIHRGLSAAR